MTRPRRAHSEEQEGARRAEIVSLLSSWWEGAKRDLPWRRTRDPYAILLSEVMCQQTRVDTVIPYYERFLERLPTVRSLAEAPLETVLSLWSGLGYYRRARMLHETARAVVGEHGGELPDSVPELRSLPGIGPYTAGAIASIAFGRSEALVDGNVARVLSRLFAVEPEVSKGPGQKRIWEIARTLVPRSDPGDWNQALMELGALVCVPDKPGCLVCPLMNVCEGRAQGKEQELPRISKKAKPLPLHRVAIVATSLGKSVAFVLGRREASGVFGGMWEPPGVPVERGEKPALAINRALALLFGDSADFADSAVRVGTVKHILSHRVLSIDVVKMVLQSRISLSPPFGEYDAIEYVSETGMKQRGITTLARKIMGIAAVPGTPG